MKVVIRADASVLNGGGHIARSSKIAEELAAQGAEIFWACSHETLEMCPELQKYNTVIVSDVDSGPDKKIIDEDEQCRQAQVIIDTVGAFDLMVIDQYFLSNPFEDAMRSHANKIAVIDEKLNRPHSADMIFDFMPHTTSDWVDLGLIDEGVTHVCSGPDYIMLSSLFSKLADKRLKPIDMNERHQRAGVKAAERIVITSGAFDGVNIIGRMLKAIDADATLNNRVKIDIPILDKAPHIKELRQRIKAMQSKGYDIALHENCTTVPDLISKADIHVGSAATSTYEAGASGGVAGLYYDCGHIQKEIGELAQNSGASLYMGHHKDFAQGQFMSRLKQLVDNPRLRDLRRIKSARFCDGQGLARTVKALTT